MREICSPSRTPWQRRSQARGLLLLATLRPQGGRQPQRAAVVRVLDIQRRRVQAAVLAVGLVIRCCCSDPWVVQLPVASVPHHPSRTVGAQWRRWTRRRSRPAAAMQLFPPPRLLQQPCPWLPGVAAADRTRGPRGTACCRWWWWWILCFVGRTRGWHVGIGLAQAPGGRCGAVNQAAAIGVV